ncbi:MAG: hypothetical protein IJ491_08010 [Clostridia bacterium]|nr:hypothetical protein [Clostridia bacterium]
MNLEQYLQMPNCSVPGDILSSLEGEGNITATDFHDKDSVLYDKSLHNEAGYRRLADGDYLVSMYCPMPDVTSEMVSWWFWWHPQNSMRYKIWYPGEHFAVSYDKKDKAYFTAEAQPPFKSNIQYPVEKIGKLILPLSIEFVSPTDFGFSEKAMMENNVAAIVCGHVGAFGRIFQHTEMAHIFFQRENGLFMVSRFWLGKRLRNPLIRKAMLNSGTAKGMAKHCCVEYRNFAERIPLLFNSEYAGRK